MIKLEFGNVDFSGGKGTQWTQSIQRTQRKIIKVRWEPTTTSTDIWHQAQIKPGHNGGRRVLSTQYQPCSQSNKVTARWRAGEITEWNCFTSNAITAQKGLWYQTILPHHRTCCNPLKLLLFLLKFFYRVKDKYNKYIELCLALQ